MIGVMVPSGFSTSGEISLEQNELTSYEDSNQINFAVVGDVSLTPDSLITLKKIESENPEVILFMFSHTMLEEVSPQEWFKATDFLGPEKIHITIGDYDKNEYGNNSELEYLEHYGLKKNFYSFNYENVHFIGLATYVDHSPNSEQYNFLKEDLITASNDPNIDWTIVWFMHPLYSSYSELYLESRNDLQPLFDTYDVDLVLQGDDHVYERTKPLKFNGAITDNSFHSYIDPSGQIYATVGTGGENHGYWKSNNNEWSVTKNHLEYGFLNIILKDNNTKLFAEFKTNTGEVLDFFQICLSEKDLTETNISRFDFSKKDFSCTNLEGVDLSGMDLRGANLADANLKEVDLSGADFRGSNLEGSNLSGANLENANLARAYLSGANLENANLARAYLFGANLENANLVGANLSGANLENANLVRSNLPGAYLENMNLVEASLSGANLENANLVRSNLSGANLENANLARAYLSGANLENANLARAYLFGANLENANLVGANLSGANLENANLVRSNLPGAYLENMNLVEASLSGANLENANLVRSNLSGANLVGANLVGAYLENANLVGANLSGANLENMNCESGTESVNGICQVIQTEEPEKEKGGGCLIATATYGSELATEVQQLRELRDNQLMNTESGTAFMRAFNDIYYSFSPVIADYERENPLFKEVVKIAITPMISSLSLMENANSESEVLGMGLSVIMLNIGMYLGVPSIVVIGIRKQF